MNLKVIVQGMCPSKKHVKKDVHVKVFTFDSLGRNIFTEVDSTFSRITQPNITTFFVGPKVEISEMKKV